MQVWHMSGAGNDFMVIDARGLSLDFSDHARRLCALTGADGFMAVDHSQEADFRLHFYNSDGSRGEMCGNGSRCVARFAFDNGIAPAEMTIQADAGIVGALRISENQYRVRLNDPSVVDLARSGNCAYVELGDPGIPHGVLEIPELRHEDRDALRELAVKHRFDPNFPKGANVNFYRLLDSNTVRILTFERGVEDYTLACGTGSGATAVTLWHKGIIGDGAVTLQNPGGDLRVEIVSDNGQIRDLFLSGPADVLKIYEL